MFSDFLDFSLIYSGNSRNYCSYFILIALKQVDQEKIAQKTSEAIVSVNYRSSERTKTNDASPGLHTCFSELMLAHSTFYT